MYKIFVYIQVNAKISRLGSKAAKVKLKKIGGSLYKWWSVWFNSTIHGKSYQRILKFYRRFLLNLPINFKLVLHGCRQFVL